MPVKYLLDHFQATFIRKPVPRYGMMQLAPGQSPTGYGKKISANYMAVIGKQKHRVYCVCYSNSGSLYVFVKGEAFYLRDFDIPDAVRHAVRYGK